MERLIREGFALFVDNQKESLSDNDFYSYLGVTVRTQKNAFIGRLNTMKAVIEELEARVGDTVALKVVGYHDYMMTKYQDTIDYFTKN